MFIVIYDKLTLQCAVNRRPMSEKKKSSSCSVLQQSSSSASVDVRPGYTAATVDEGGTAAASRVTSSVMGLRGSASTNSLHQLPAASTAPPVRNHNNPAHR